MRASWLAPPTAHAVGSCQNKRYFLLSERAQNLIKANRRLHTLVPPHAAILHRKIIALLYGIRMTQIARSSLGRFPGGVADEATEASSLLHGTHDFTPNLNTLSTTPILTSVISLLTSTRKPGESSSPP